MSRHIYIYSPSGAVRDKAAFRRALARLRAMGHEVEVDEAALASHQRFAGDDEVRLAAIHRAAASGADVALISRGGYGLTRILPHIRYGALAKAVERGMHLVGMSDFTALQCALLAHTGARSWAGPALCEGFGGEAAPDEIMQACFDDLLLGQGEGAGWRQRRPRSPAAMDSGAGHSISTGISEEFTIKNRVLWGGNLALLAALVGTPYLPDIRGGILFLEDVAEHPYRVERMLTQLLLSGVLARQKAVLLGQFTDYTLVPHDRGFNLLQVERWLRERIKAPVLNNLPYGHVATKVLLPVGAKVDLVVQGSDALLYWG